MIGVSSREAMSACVHKRTCPMRYQLITPSGYSETMALSDRPTGSGPASNVCSMNIQPAVIIEPKKFRWASIDLRAVWLWGTSTPSDWPIEQVARPRFWFESVAPVASGKLPGLRSPLMPSVARFHVASVSQRCSSRKQLRTNERKQMLTTRYDEAFQYAHELHGNQKRKGTSIPYISHLLIVSALVIENGGTEDQAIGALLHDAAEDQGGRPTLDEVRKRFGSAVAQIVSDCTDAWDDPKPLWRPRKEAYLSTLPAKPPQSLLVSLADKTHNAEAILYDYRVLGDGLWDRFNGGALGTRWYYQSLAEIFSEVMPGRLSDRLFRAATAFSI
jgi:hypothetical protein